MEGWNGISENSSNASSVSFNLQCSNRVLALFHLCCVDILEKPIYIGLRVLLLLLVEPSLISVKLTNPYSIIICNVFGII